MSKIKYLHPYLEVHLSPIQDLMIWRVEKRPRGHRGLNKLTLRKNNDEFLN